MFPDYIAEDFHSELLKDWFPVPLIAAFNMLDLVRYCQCDWLLGWPPVLSTLDSVHLILPKLAICIYIL